MDQMDTDIAEDSLSSPLTETASVHEGDFEFETIKVEPDIEWITVETTAPADKVADVHKSVPYSFQVEANGDESPPATNKRRTTTKKNNNKKCDECGLRLDSAEAMDDHRALHRAICPFRCSECAASFPERAQLARHRLDAHVEPRERFPCQYCKAVLWSESAKTTHRKKLHPAGQNPPVLAPPFRCSYCGRRFTTDTQLASHAAGHGPLPFSCPVCSLALASVSELMQHVKEHPEVPKPFSCPDCAQDFDTFAGINVHARKHSGPRPCTECGALYFSAAELDRHMEEHGGLVHLDRFLQLITLTTDAQVVFSESG